MDISSWIQFNPKITVDHTRKKFFGKYLYKIVLYAPAGRLVDGKRSLEIDLEHRLGIAQHISQSWWHQRANKDIDKVDLGLLEKIKILRSNCPTGIKLRIEEPRIQIYANTEQQLIDIMQLQIGSQYYNYIESISGPADADAEELLNSGAIIRKKDTGYQYKVILRDGRYGQEVKQNMLQYLQNLDETTVHLPKGCRDMLSTSNSYAWNLYFLTNDPQVTSFLSLIQPGIVSNIHELVILQNK
jgi:hypothetical protein